MSRLCYDCDKQGHNNKSEAKRAIRNTNDSGLHAYRCPFGAGWHIGHMPENVIRGIITRAEWLATKKTPHGRSTPR